MNGHKVNAREIATAIAGRPVALDDVPPPFPAIPGTLLRLSAGKPVRATVMEPFDTLVEPALQQVVPGRQVEVTRWPVQGKSLAQIEANARDGVGWQHFQEHPEEARPHLVLIAVPPEAAADGEGAFIRSYSWVLNWSLSFGVQEWDCMAVLPSVAQMDLDAEGRHWEALAREVIRGQDIGFVERPADDGSAPIELIARWMEEQARSRPGLG